MTTKKLPDPTPQQLARLETCQRAGKPCADRIQHQWKNGRLVNMKIVSLCGFIIAGTPCKIIKSKVAQGVTE